MVMPTFSKILVATDCGPSSECAVRWAAALAARSRACLTVLHAIEGAAYAFPFPPSPQLDDEARMRLDSLVAGLTARGLRADWVLREGLAADEICAAALDARVDLVVVGSHGRSGLPRFVHGSVAERVVRLAPVPVLTVHSADEVKPGEGGPVRRILAPTDFSDASRRSVEAALKLAIDFDAVLTVLHVCELPVGLQYVTEDVAKEVEAQARQKLDATLASVRLLAPKAEGNLRRGNAWAGIVAAAEEHASDLIVVGTHGRRGLERAFLGSVAEKVVRLAPVPVLAVSHAADHRDAVEGPGAST
jgi:nucleotide-binding universal stress UspA family protein